MPKGTECDHLCRNHSCIWDEHLEVVPHVTNMRRAIFPNSSKTHCPKGHLLTGENLLPGQLKNGRRGCRKCAVASSHRRYRLKLKIASKSF
jgi:hypothetical protein